jgi:two-component system, NarL family, sensor kinase
MEPTLSEFTILFSIATGGMLLLALAIVFFVIFYQKKMLEARLRQQHMEVEFQQKMVLATLESQENERQRLAGELHDSIGAMLSTIRLSMLTIARNEGTNTESVQQTKKMIDDTIDSVRRISRDLMPSTLQKFGLTQAVAEMCEQYAAVSGVDIHFSKQGDEHNLDKTKEILVFRILQELINNAMKHAQATSIHVSFIWTSATLEALVNDDGVGFNADEKNQSLGGLGLFNMQNRARILNATFRYEPEWQKGTKATLTLPLS